MITSFQEPLETSMDCQAVIERLYKHLRHNPEVDRVFAIVNAKVPIIKLTMRPKQLEVDISFYNILVSRAIISILS